MIVPSSLWKCLTSDLEVIIVEWTLTFKSGVPIELQGQCEYPTYERVVPTRVTFVKLILFF